MKKSFHPLAADQRSRRFIVFAALACAASASHATLTFYSNQTSFNAASATALDTFTGIGTFASLASVNRTVGDDSYRIWAPTAPGNSGKTQMLITQSTANPAVSVYYYGVPMVIDSFASADPSTPVQAIGGSFFNVGSAATYRAGNVTLTAIDSDGTSLTRTVAPTFSGGVVSSFSGFVTTATLVSLTIAPASASASAGYEATVDNLRLGSGPVAAVPEPETYALLLAGLGAVGTVARRRRVAR